MDFGIILSKIEPKLCFAHCSMELLTDCLKQ